MVAKCLRLAGRQIPQVDEVPTRFAIATTGSQFDAVGRICNGVDTAHVVAGNAPARQAGGGIIEYDFSTALFRVRTLCHDRVTNDAGQLAPVAFSLGGLSFPRRRPLRQQSAVSFPPGPNRLPGGAGDPR